MIIHKQIYTARAVIIFQISTNIANQYGLHPGMQVNTAAVHTGALFNEQNNAQ